MRRQTDKRENLRSQKENKNEGPQEGILENFKRSWFQIEENIGSSRLVLRIREEGGR